MDQNVVVRQAKTAASRGEERFRMLLIWMSRPVVNGRRLGRFEEAGANFAAPSKAAAISTLLMDQVAP